MKIRSVILYGINGRIRRLDFNLQTVNFITGKSGTGKSSILNIIDYCLGRDDFIISEGRIRDSVTWYALLLQIESQQVFIAKPSPKRGATKQTSVYFKAGVNPEVPTSMDEIETNSNNADLIKFLSELIGISENFYISEDGKKNEPLRVTFRHALFFCLQDQGEVANKSVLFHRQAEPLIPQAIKDSLPYFLGASNENFVKLQRELRQAKRDYKIAERVLNESRDLAAEGYRQGQTLIEEAVASGVLPLEKRKFETPLQMLELLKSVSSWVPRSINEPQTDRLSELRDELSKLNDEFRQLSNQIRVAELSSGHELSYKNEVREQINRLEAIHLFEDDNDLGDVTRCPICQGKLETKLPLVEEIRGNLKKLRLESNITNQQRPKIDRYISEHKQKLDLLKEKILQIETSIQSIERDEIGVDFLKDTDLRAMRVLGRISLYLENVRVENSLEKMQANLEDVAKKIQEKEEELNILGGNGFLESALNVIGNTMTMWAKELKLEFSESPYRFDINRLSVISDRNGRPVFMSNMGGGENWLRCHIITILAIHKYLIDQSLPAPRFIVLDQPTQVYFPPERFGGNDDSSLESLSDEDRKAVEELFSFLITTCEQLEGKLQIIVLDHAEQSNEEFQKRIVDEPWRNGHALIPSDWTDLDFKIQDGL